MKYINNLFNCGSLSAKYLIDYMSGVTAMVILIFVSGCASTTRFTPVDYCSQPTNPNMARFILTRSNSLVGSGFTFRIFDDEQPSGDIGPGDQLCWDRYPGVALVSSLSHANGGMMRLKVEAKANTTYYLVLKPYVLQMKNPQK